MKTIEELFRDIDCRFFELDAELAVGGISSDSRKVKKGDLFIALRGHEHDGHDYIGEAIERGASVVCTQEANPNFKAGCVLVKSTARILPVLASRFFDAPAESLKLIGITGTNGKTTVSYLVYETLKKVGRSPSLLGSIQYKIGDDVAESVNTTPGPLPLHGLLSRMRECGTDYAVMEVSSHALRQSRVAGIDFRIAALTNITGDHLDYHKTMKDYVKSKRLLFDSLKKDSVAVINRDEKCYREFKKFTKARVISYGIEKMADFKARHIDLDINGSHFSIDTPGGTFRLRTSLIGRHNVYNILAAASIAFAEGIEIGAVTEAIGCFNQIPGRLEPVDAGQRFKIFVDYAHTHDALKNVLSGLREFCRGKIIVVFGCGGNRDKTKRPKMGRAASRLADFVVLTSDNPRRENPGDILCDIEKGFPRDFKDYEKIPDRFEAIAESLIRRDPSDIVLIAGKGHEDYQIIGEKSMPFNDRKAVEEILGGHR